MENQNKVVTPSTPEVLAALANARHGLVKGAKSTGEVIKGYANAMCTAFNIVGPSGTITTPWYDLKGKDKAGVKSERDAFVAEMIGAGFDKPTIDVYWGRVKVASGYQPKGKVSGGNDTDSLTLKELKTMINRIFKAEEKGEDCKASDIKGSLMECFEAMGGEVDTLG